MVDDRRAAFGAWSAAMLLSTDIWVSALIRRAELSGAFGMVIRKGDARAGAVLVKVLNRPQGTARLYAEATRLDGERVWMQPAPSDHEPDLDRYIERAMRVDPDIWVVEIDDREGRHFLTEPVETG
jgi:hypothetical protein